MRSLAAICSIVLIPVYAYVLFAIFNPKVSQEYVNYYINKTTSLTVKQQQDLKKSGSMIPIALGNSYLHDDNEHLVFDGWSGAEETYRWSDRKNPRILFHLSISAVPMGLYKIRIQALPNGTQELTLSINKVRSYKYILNQEQEITMEVSSLDLKDGLNEIAFVIPDARQPGNGDTRTLGLAIKLLKIE